ncbi:helix-turn-helix transcriptional regulator [Paraburkholderia bryophila]|uniref:AraC-like DNA-binding protein n=1 Tax=Paraburkholderia bryophila TaxID=420952 RepID=A0A7Z0B4E9_9BURK|nr:AraC family transcriptional regulator [Paraburkholderia bryophila]NYH19297.1 AraC-like DNA-binding protein [Paraburkholderia bryophila]
MAETFALHEGAFGRISLLSLRTGLVSHAHSEAHIVWWLGGADAEARIGTQIFRYSEAQASAVNPFEQHDLKLLSTSTPAIFFAVYINKAWLDKKADTAGRPFVFASPRITIGPEVRACLWQLLDLIMSHPEQQEKIDAAVDELIGVSIRASLATHSPGLSAAGCPLLSRKLRLAVGLMRERVDVRSTIDDIASEAGLSRTRLFALFRDQLNTTPQVFWSAIRLEEAIRKLMTGDVPLISVAHELGFSAASNFSRFFKEHTGVSPSDYRRAALVQPLTGLPL